MNSVNKSSAYPLVQNMHCNKVHMCACMVMPITLSKHPNRGEKRGVDVGYHAEISIVGIDLSAAFLPENPACFLAATQGC